MKYKTFFIIILIIILLYIILNTKDHTKDHTKYHTKDHTKHHTKHHTKYHTKHHTKHNKNLLDEKKNYIINELIKLESTKDIIPSSTNKIYLISAYSSKDNNNNNNFNEQLKSYPKKLYSINLAPLSKKY